jgi:diguanylate cyclase (GGDEF)-like protein
VHRRNRASSSSVEDRYKVLLDVGRILTATLEPEVLYRSIFEQTTRVLDLSGFAVATYDDAKDQAAVVFHSENDEARPPGNLFPGASCAAIRTRKPTLTTKPAESVPPGLNSKTGFANIAAPMIHDQRVVGVISAYSFSTDPYEQADLELLAAIADLAAVAVTNAHFVEEREQRRHEAERLEQIGRSLTASLDLPSVLSRVVSTALDLTRADSAAVWLIRNEYEVEIAMTAGDIAPPRGLVFPIPEALKQHPGQTEPIVFADIKSAGGNFPEQMRALSPAASTMAVVLVADNEILGVLSIGHKDPHQYSPDEVSLLQRLSYQAAIAVANARLHERILAHSLTDPLTGLPNRRHLEMFLQKEFAAARRGRRLTVMLFDLDNFKEYNDRAGHQAGDEVLRAFATVLSQHTRAMNLAARFGGDEFISILADTDRRGGFVHATRIARAVANDKLLGSAGIKASTGIASYNARMAEPADLVRAADRDLYARKTGRGREIRA